MSCLIIFIKERNEIRKSDLITTSLRIRPITVYFLSFPAQENYADDKTVLVLSLQNKPCISKQGIRG